LSITLSKKKDIIEKIKSIGDNAKSIIVTNYQGLTSPEITKLRSYAREKDVNLFIAKNNLLKIGLKNTIYNNFDEYLKGQSLLFFSNNELSSSAKVIKDFCKNNDKLKVNIISLSGKIFSGDDLEYVSNLPTKKEAIQSFIFLLKMPINKLLNTVKYPKLKLIILLKELSKKPNI
jgi:large subunit ribosomal protein L10